MTTSCPGTPALEKNELYLKVATFDEKYFEILRPSWQPSHENLPSHWQTSSIHSPALEHTFSLSDPGQSSQPVGNQSLDF